MNDLSARSPVGRFLDGRWTVYTSFFPPLHALKVRLRATPTRSALVFRAGGPAGGTRVFERDRVRDRLSYDLDDFLGLWHRVATHLFTPDELRRLQRGEDVDRHRRNVLDKIEQSWVERRWHPTAFEALLYLAHGDSPSDFMARRGPRLPDDIPRENNRFPPVGVELPWPARDGLWDTMPQLTGVSRTLVLTYRACIDDSADAIASRLTALLREYGTPIGSFPRVTREPDLGALCLSRVTAAWPFQIVTPRYVGEASVASAFRTILGDERAVLTVTQYSSPIHGSLDFWETGRAAQTATRDSASIVAAENPTGPNSARPPSALERLIDASKSGLPVGALALGVGIAAGLLATRVKRP